MGLAAFNRLRRLKAEEAAKQEEGTPFDNMSIEDLKAYAEENEIDLGRSSSHDGILKKIVEATSKE